MTTRYAPKLTEKSFQSQVVGLARMFGWLAYHSFDSRRSAPGFPDIVLVHRRRKLFVMPELKVGKNRLTPEQQLWIDTLTDVGIDARVWRPEDWPEIEKLLIGA